MNTLSSILKLWFILAVTLTLMCGIIYIVVQQNYRLTANDPQTSMANDAANDIDNGMDPITLVTNPPLDLSNSLSPYLIIYNGNKEPVASGTLLNGKIPELPSGVLDYVKKNGEDVISWQPRPGIRQALVIKKTKGNLFYVAAGRSLQKTEERISVLGKQIMFGWICSVIIIFFVIWIIKILPKQE